MIFLSSNCRLVLPAEHWDHLRTTNPIESVFANVRTITVVNNRQADGIQAGHRRIENLATAQSTNQLLMVIAGVRFNYGIGVIQMPANRAARLVTQNPA
ncbi:hypothetical protein [Afipia clevelandensis]|uniref:hypothetical protein n=1 Tax=Afipia clevelandensis TaxID=1034 RepID=UPI00030CBAAD